MIKDMMQKGVQKMMRGLSSFLKLFQHAGNHTGNPDADQEVLLLETFKRRQKTWIAGGVGVLFLVLFLAFRESTTHTTASPRKTPVVVDPPTAVVGDKELWTQRLKRQTQAAEKRAEEAEKHVKFLDKKLALLAASVEVLTQSLIPAKMPAQDLPLKENAETPQPPPSSAQQSSFVRSSVGDIGETRSLLPTPSVLPPSFPPQEHAQNHTLLHLSLPDMPLPKSVKSYIPSGSYVRAVLTSGVVASSAVGAESNPQPLMMRLLEGGNLPRGFKGDLKDAVLIASCYGDLSSERAMCRLQRLSLTEPNGEVIEKDIEGWIVGEDGRPGIKGIVIDRAGEVARSSIIAGILGGVGKFFDAQSRLNLPIPGLSASGGVAGGYSPPETLTMLKGGAASGVSNAFDKLAEFSIKRAEQMQPVILIASGRQVDVVFKEGVELKTFAQKNAEKNLIKSELSSLKTTLKDKRF